MKILKKVLYLALLIYLTLPLSPVAAQTSSSPSATPQSGSDGVIDFFGSAVSQLISGNNVVQLENPKNYFSPDQYPQFTLIAPNADTIQAKVIRKSISEEVTLKVDKQDGGKFLITFANPFIILDQYSLDIVAKESFFYNRHLILDFSWGPSTSSGLNTEQAQTSWMKSFLEERPEYKNMPIVKKSANSVHFKKPDGKIEANFTGNPINYQDSQGNWQPIDTTLKPVSIALSEPEASRSATTDFSGSGTPVIISSDGTVKVKNSTHSQKTTRFGYFDPATKQFISLQDLPEGTIQNNQYIQETKEYKHVLTLLDTGLKEELTLFSPPQNTKYEILNTNYLVLETEVTGIDLPDGWVDQFTIDKQNFPLPTTKDATGKEIETKRYAIKIGGKQYIYTGIPTNTLTSAAYPVMIDPDFQSTSPNAYIWGDNATYTTARSTSADYSSPASIIVVGQRSDGGYRVYRGYLYFDTGSIGAGSTVTQANLKLVITTDDSATDFDVQIAKEDWSAQNPITSLVREAAYDNCLSATLDDNIWKNTSGLSVNTQYSSGNLNTAWINKTGSTYYGLRSSRDSSATTPTGYERVIFASILDATVGYRPVLTVLYDAAPTPTPTPTPTVTPTLPPAMRFSGVEMSGICVGNAACPTIVPTSTPAPQLFADDFESGNLTAWTTSFTDGGNLSVAAGAALHGSYGLSVLVNDTAPLVVQDQTPNSETRYRCRWYFDPNSIYNAGWIEWVNLLTYDSSWAANPFHVNVDAWEGSWSIRAVINKDDGSEVYSTGYDISDAPHYIEVDWKASSAPAANDGYISLWIDGVLKETVSGIDNDTRNIGAVLFGAQWLGGGTGTFYLDDFVSNNDGSVIGAYVAP